MIKEMKPLKVISFVLALFTLACFLAACNPAQGGTESDSPKESYDGTPTESIPEESAPATVTVKEAISIIADGNCGYTIVRPELASDGLKQAAMSMRHTLGELMEGGSMPTVAEDWLNPFTDQKPLELEILIGACDRDETREALAGIKYNDWTVDIVGKKLIIAGHTEESTLAALDYFNESFLSLAESGDELIFTPDDCHTERAEYKLEDIVIGGDSLVNYKIVIPSLCGTQEKTAAEELARFMSETTGFSISVVRDSTEVSENEILIGKTNREESKKLLDTLLYDDYAMAVEGKKIVLMGYLAENTVKVCDTLKNLVELKTYTADSMELTDKDSFEYKHKYDAEVLILRGGNIKDYDIVYPHGNEMCQMIANSIKKAIISKFGYSLDVISDKTKRSAEREILIGNTNRSAKGGEAESLISSFDGGNTEGLIAASDRFVLICGGDNGGFGKAVSKFIQHLVPESVTGTHTVELSDKEVFKVETEDVKVMSYNILTWPDTKRMSEIVSIIKDYAPDVIGMQEAVPYAVIDLKAQIGDTYDYVHLERDNATGESTPIWYNKHKYTLIESGSGWLSDTPDTMSKYPESEYVRVYVYAILENKETGARFVHVNTHLDFAAAQTKQTGKLLALTSRFSFLPMFYTADWNFTPGSQGYALMHNAGYMDASVLTTNVHGSGTCVGSTSEIDFCFTSVLNTSVDSYRVIDDHDFSQTSSDHYPIFVELKIVK